MQNIRMKIYVAYVYVFVVNIYFMLVAIFMNLLETNKK